MLLGSQLLRSPLRPSLRGVYPGGPLLTPLQRILALSPSALYWPAQGAGWQGTTGGTLAASGQPVGLLPDLSQLGGKTPADWLATAPELAPAVGALTGSTQNDGAAASTFSAGVWDITGSSSLSSYPRLGITIPGITTGKVYRVSGEIALTGISSVTMRLASAGTANNVAAGVTSTFDGVAVAAIDNQINIYPVGTPTGTLTFVSLSVRELPGNHLRAGTWASPADSSRALLTAGGALNFDGVDDYYSLLNAIPITEQMTVVRAFKRASAGINSIGLGAAAAGTPHEGRWATNNNYAVAFPNLRTSGPSTDTGSFVFTSRRNASDTTIRRNGAEVLTNTTGAPSDTLDALGRRNTIYNSGEISFLAVFPTELTGADLALVEQIAAATNGATLA